MTTAIANELSRIAMSQHLAQTLTRASALAGERGHPEVTLEHALVALIDDPDAEPVLSASAIDSARLRAEITEQLARTPLSEAGGEPRNLAISADLKRILSAAAAAAQQGRRSEISGAIVLAAIVGDGQSTAAQLLRAQGLTFDAAIRALQHAANAARAPDQPQRPPASAPAPEQRPEVPRFGQRTTNPSPQIGSGTAALSAADLILASARERVFNRAAASASDVREPDHQGANATAPLPAAPSPLIGAESNGPIERALRIEPQFSDLRSASAGQPVSRSDIQHPGLAAPDWRTDQTPSALPAALPELATPHRPEVVMQRATPSRVEARPAQSRRRPATGIEAGQLAHNIPRNMRVAKPCVVEARIAKANVRALAEGLQSGSGAYRHEIMVTKAMSVRLRAPQGGFYIEAGSPETQWIENTFGLLTDEFASWRWQITPRMTGRRRLQLMVSARTVGADGLAAETALPDQIIDLRVGPNYGAAFRMLGAWFFAAVVGAMLALFGEPLYAGSAKVIARLFGS